MQNISENARMDDPEALRERIQALEEENASLKEQQNYYSPFFRYGRDIMAISDFNGNILDANPVTEELLGYQKDEFLNTSFLNYIYKEDLNSVYETIAMVRNGQPTPGSSVRFIHKNGSLKWFSWKSFPMYNKYIYSIGRDITEQVYQAQQIEQNETKFRSIFHEAPVGIAFFNKYGNWLDVNEAYTSILGYSKEELFQLTMMDITHPDDIEENQEMINKIYYEKSHSYYHLEKRYVHKDGSTVWADVSLQAIRDNEGDIDYIIAICRDNTNRKKAERELVFKNYELNTFLYRSSHDLKGPVSTLQGICNLGIKQTTDSEALKYFRLINQTVDQFNVILDRLLQLGEIKQKTLESRNVCPELFSRKIVDDLIYRHSIQLNYRINNNLNNNIYYDDYLLNIVLYNLMENAVRFSPFQDMPYLSVDFDSDETGNVVISVEDNGTGIQPELQETVFNMFTKGSEDSRGAGLGLYMVKSAVERMGGCIYMYSYPEKGTTFKVCLPPGNQE